MVGKWPCFSQLQKKGKQKERLLVQIHVLDQQPLSEYMQIFIFTKLNQVLLWKAS